MIKSLLITNYLDESIRVELTRPQDTGFIITKIDGIGTGEASINTTELATADGALYNSARLQSRSVTINIEFMQTNTESIERIRQKTYKYFHVKKPVTVQIDSDVRSVYFTGYVESNDPDIFSEKEACTITIMCPDPYIYLAGNSGNQITVFSGIVPNFEFPFANDMVEDEYNLTDRLSGTVSHLPFKLAKTQQEMLEMGIVENYTYKNIAYDGDIEIGMTISIHCIGIVSGDINIYNLDTREKMTISVDKIAEYTGSGLVYGDDIVIDTRRGNKSIKLIRTGVTTNILNCLEKNASWFTLRKGNNQFAYTADVGVLYLQFSVNNQIAYEGV